METHQTFGKRGFVTIATGDVRYYNMARNLLHSYHFHTSAPYPFALICDRENKATAEFDNVILLDKPTHSYLDKLRLFECMPYEETIFIDADSLAYGDLNEWFEIFNGYGDFSCFGYAYRDLNVTKGWFSVPGMQEYDDCISFIPSFNGGVYYMRKTETCQRVFDIARKCAEHYSSYAFNWFREPADEPVLALGMAVCKCEPVNMDEIVFAPKQGSMELNIVSGIARRTGQRHDVRLIHWSNYRTLKSEYQFEIRKMDFARTREKSFRRVLYEHGFARTYLWVYDVIAFCHRVKRKIKKEWKKSGSSFSLKH